MDDVMHRWTPAEDVLLSDLSLTYAQIAERLGLTRWQVVGRIQKLGLQRGVGTNQPSAWPALHVQKLRELAPTMSYEEIAAQLGRSSWAVAQKAYKLGIKGRSKSQVQRDRGAEHHWYVDGTGKSTYAGYRGDDWPEARRAALERDGYCCQQPGCDIFSPGEHLIVVHHLVPWRITEDNSLENLMTLCRAHHAQRPEHAAATLFEALDILEAV